MEEKWKYHYVHRDLVRAWSDDGVHVDWCNPFEESSSESTEMDSLYWGWIDPSEKDLIELVENTDILFGNEIDAMKKNDFSFLYRENCFGRFNMLFQHMRTETYTDVSMDEDDFASLSALDQSPEEKKSTAELLENLYKLRTQMLRCVTSDILRDEIQLLRYDAVLLKAPGERTFIIGGSPMNLINPFFSGRYPDYEGREYEISGSCFIMPLSPDLSLCLYDSDIYRFRKKNGVCLISEDDVDILNMVQIFNGGKYTGFVYKGDREKITDTIHRFGDVGVREDFSNLDIYPFDTELSCALVKAENEDDFSSIYNDPVPEFVKDIRKYSEEMKKRQFADTSKYNDERHKRFVYAHNYLFNDQIEE